MTGRAKSFDYTINQPVLRDRTPIEATCKSMIMPLEYTFHSAVHVSVDVFENSLQDQLNIVECILACVLSTTTLIDLPLSISLYFLIQRFGEKKLDATYNVGNLVPEA